MKKMLSATDLESQAVLALPSRLLLRQRNYIAVFAVVAQVSVNQCNFCIQSNNNIIEY